MKFIRPASGLENFTPRGSGGSRLEALSDGVFALAIAMLLVSTSVPSNYDELERFVADLVPFGICSIFLFWIWREHVTYFHRYGLTEDRLVIRLSFALTMLVPFYIYALKFLMGWLVGLISGLLKMLVGIPAREEIALLMTQVPTPEMHKLMMIYAVGFMGVFGLFYFLYRYAESNADALRLSPLERLETAHTRKQNLLLIGTGFLSFLVALTGYFNGSAWASFIAGSLYNLIPIGSVWLDKRRNRELEDLKKKLG